jgi:CubicO group peptidase (beta-lactamase class C family)
LTAVLLLASSSALAQETAPTLQGPQSAADLEAFLDGIMAAHMETHHIAGATISVVKDGELFFAKGYGTADVKDKKPVAADRTLFRIASISKLFTWTAVMQLVEQGKLDLNADVNTYLKDVKVPATFPQPITLTHLLTHTPGFEDILGFAVRRPEELMPLGQFIKENMPTRVWPPGEFTAYSNYGTALAGYIVELISGMPFEDYIERNIYDPLGMTRSSFRQPPPGALAADVSTGYRFENGVFKGEEFELLNGENPDGSMSTTATDIARFMIAHLQNGEFEGRRILKEETARLMHTRLFSHDPRIGGNAYGFWERHLNGLLNLEHGGDITCFHSLLMLIPERNAGFFVSYNSTGSSGLTRYELYQAFLDRYYPRPAMAEPAPAQDFQKRAERYAGTYEMNRRSYTKFDKLVALITPVKFKPTPEGNLLLVMPAGLGTKAFVEVEKDVFREAGGQEKIIFRESGAGKADYAFYSAFPEMAFVRLKGTRVPSFHYLVAGVSVVLFLTAALGWPLGALGKVICKKPRLGNPAPKAARWLGGGMSALFLLFILGLGMALSDLDQFNYGVPSFFKISLGFPVAAAALAVGVLIFTVIIWRKKCWTGCARVHYTLVLLAAVGFLWLLNFWNLLGWRL